MAVWNPQVSQHLITHMHLAYDPEHLALRVSLPAGEIRRLTPEAQELFLETVVNCWKENCPDWKLDEVLVTLRPEES
jgi:hypothetical protein